MIPIYLLYFQCSLAFMCVSLFVCVLMALPHSALSWFVITAFPGLEVIKLEFILRFKIKRNNWHWLLADTCPQAANHCALFCNL